MPKNTVTDPITDQEMAFAHLVLSGTMNDRRAAEAVGLNPETAAYTKAKPRVRAYMIEHRAAVSERLVDQEAEGLRQLNLGRDQILARLWELANLNPEATRGSMAGQIKALSMIVAIEGLIPSGTMNDRRLSPSRDATRGPARPRRKSTSLSGAPNSSTNLWARSQATPLPARKPHPPRPRSPTPSLHRSLRPSRPPNWLTTRRSSTLTGPNPALPIPSSTPEARTGFPPRPTASSTPFWTKPAPSGCPFPQGKASLGGAAELYKKPNFIEFYKISRSVDPGWVTEPKLETQESGDQRECSLTATEKHR